MLILAVCQNKGDNINIFACSENCLELLFGWLAKKTLRPLVRVKNAEGLIQRQINYGYKGVMEKKKRKLHVQSTTSASGVVLSDHVRSQALKEKDESNLRV